MRADRREAIEQLFVQYAQGVGSYLLARLGDVELSEEITSRVFLTVVRQYHQCRGSAVGWLWSIVRSELARHFRGQRRPAALSEELCDPADPPLDRLAQRETENRLQAALAQLDDEEQQIVSMKFFLRLRNTDIAEALGQTPTNVGVKIHRALRKIEQLMGPVCEHDPT